MEINNSKLSDAIHLIKNLKTKICLFIKEADKIKKQLDTLEIKIYEGIIEAEKEAK